MESEHLRRRIVRSYYDRTTIVTIVVRSFTIIVRSYDPNTIVSTIVLRSYFDRSTIVVRSKKSYDRKRSYYDRRQPVIILFISAPPLFTYIFLRIFGHFINVAMTAVKFTFLSRNTVRMGATHTWCRFEPSL